MLQKPLITTSLLFLITLSVQSFAINKQSSGARSLGLANANTTLLGVWSCNNNQAGLGAIKTFSMGASYQNRFGLSELALSNLNLAVPIKFGTLGITVQQFGFSEYNENKLGIAYGVALSEKVNIGTQVDYYQVSIAEAQTQNKNALAFEIGMIVKMTEKLSMGVHVFNFTNAKLTGDFEERLPMTLSIGLKYEFSKKLFSVLDIEKNIDLPTNLKMGLEYHPVQVLYFRGGLNTYDFHFTGGVGVQLNKFQLDLAISHQTYLGYVSQIALSYSIRK